MGREDTLEPLAPRWEAWEDVEKSEVG